MQQLEQACEVLALSLRFAGRRVLQDTTTTTDDDESAKCSRASKRRSKRGGGGGKAAAASEAAKGELQSHCALFGGRLDSQLNR